MTHDELLAEIDRYLVPTLAESEIGNKAIGVLKALRAVVELHKPVEQTTGMSYTQQNGLEVMMTETRCSHCSYGTGIFYYPCPTIQAIQEQLK